MSVSRTDYIIVGVRIPYNNRLCDKFDSIMDDEPSDGIVAIIDGMCGDYAFVGKVVAESNPEEEDLPITDCLKVFQDNYETVKDAFWKSENEEVRALAGKDISVWAFTHCY